MQTNNAMLAGRFMYSIQSAEVTVNSIPKDYLSIRGAMGNYIQYLFMTPLFVEIRFGKWEEILGGSKPANSLVYANLLYHFGRGIAFSHQEKFDEAGKELDAMRELMKDPVLQLPLTPFSSAIEGAKVAEQLLLGVIHLQRNLYDGAIRHFQLADSIETNMVYNEPRDWLLNPKHYLGHALLKAGKWTEAQQVFLNDLKQNKENGWALQGYYQALLSQNRKDDAAKARERFKEAFSKADVKIPSSVY
jgi:tetratricopeptide (TPR) repeat protein